MEVFCKKIIIIIKIIIIKKSKRPPHYKYKIHVFWIYRKKGWRDLVRELSRLAKKRMCPSNKDQ